MSARLAKGLKVLGEGLMQYGKTDAERRQKEIENGLAERKMALLENIYQNKIGAPAEETGTPATVNLGVLADLKGEESQPASGNLGALANLKNIGDLQKDIAYQERGYEFGLGGAPSLNSFNTAKSRQELAPKMDEFTENRNPREILSTSPVAATDTPEARALRESIYKAYPAPIPHAPTRTISPALAKLKRTQR